MKRIFYSLLIAAVILPGATAHLQARDRKPKTSKTVQAAEPVRNVILMIGDGMGLAQVTSYMLRGGAPLSLARAQSIGLQSTFSASSEVTDSAAAATALATGTKTNNGMISMTPDKQPGSGLSSSGRSGRPGDRTGRYACHYRCNARRIYRTQRKQEKRRRPSG